MGKRPDVFIGHHGNDERQGQMEDRDDLKKLINELEQAEREAPEGK